MKRFMNVIIWIGFFVLLLLTVPLTTAEQTGDSQNDMDQIKQLQKERVKDLTSLVQIMTGLYQTGNLEIKQVFSAQSELINAQLEMTDNLKERIALLEDQLKLAKTLSDLTERRASAGTSSEADKIWANSNYLKSQIDLLKERQKLKAASGSNR
jgi:outer membrane protein TolC